MLNPINKVNPIAYIVHHMFKNIQARNCALDTFPPSHRVFRSSGRGPVVKPCLQDIRMYGQLSNEKKGPWLFRVYIYRCI